MPQITSNLTVHRKKIEERANLLTPQNRASESTRFSNIPSVNIKETSNKLATMRDKLKTQNGGRILRNKVGIEQFEHAADTNFQGGFHSGFFSAQNYDVYKNADTNTLLKNRKSVLSYNGD
mmetsp:Transcript_13486/g.22960  ORF Transcript_13486/g.22960 Transcript_13486/m.22960 type:complete len:121 (-) Transcript_13486:881-1243(-)